VSNFVFPVFLSVVQLVFIFHDPNSLKVAYTYVTNSFVEIIGVLLATVWTSSSYWSDSTSTVRGTTVEGISRSVPKNGASPLSSAATPGSGRVQIKTHVETSMDSQIELGQVESHPHFAVVEKSPGVLS